LQDEALLQKEAEVIYICGYAHCLQQSNKVGMTSGSITFISNIVKIAPLVLKFLSLKKESRLEIRPRLSSNPTFLS